MPRFFPSASKYSPTDSHVTSTPALIVLSGIASASAKNSRYHAPSPGRVGAITWPHWPTMTMVWPFCTLELHRGSHTAWGS
jgi:hypothetical protein